MPRDAVAEIKARVDILDVVGEYVRLQRSGRRWVGLCPFHAERTPSFSVSQERQAWYCFGCQEGGDVLAFVEKIEHLDFRGALELLAEKAGIEVTAPGGRASGEASAWRRRALEIHERARAYFEQVLWSTPAGEPGRQLLADRGIPEEVARRFAVGYAPAGASGDALVRYLVARQVATVAEVVRAGLAHEIGRGRARDRFRGRLVFPIRDDRGATVAFAGRAIGEAVPKYLNSPTTAIYDKSAALFGLDLAQEAIASSGTAVVVEGYFDVVASHLAGVTNVVGTCGTALTSRQAKLLGRRARTVVLCFDADPAGHLAASRAVDVLVAEGLEVRICTLPQGTKDPDELVRRDVAALPRLVAAAGAEWEVLLDRALEGADAGSLAERRQAAERAVAVLARIPQAATRALYVEATARRLGIAATALASDVDRAAAGLRPRVTALRLPPPPDASGDEPLEAAASVGAPPSWEAYLGRLAVQHPSLARRLLAGADLRLEDLVDPVVARVLEIVSSVAEDQPFPTELLPPAYRTVVARHLFRPVPELDDPAAVERLGAAVADCVRRTRLAALDRTIAGLRRRAREAGDRGATAEVEDLAARLAALSAERQRLRVPQSRLAAPSPALEHVK